MSSNHPEEDGFFLSLEFFISNITSDWLRDLPPRFPESCFVTMQNEMEWKENESCSGYIRWKMLHYPILRRIFIKETLIVVDLAVKIMLSWPESWDHSPEISDSHRWYIE